MPCNNEQGGIEMDYFLELAIGTVITIITYFLKKTMDKIDKTDLKTTNFNIDTDYNNKKDRNGNYHRVFN